MAKALWNVRYRGAYNPGDKRDGVKQGLFWVNEKGTAEETESAAREAAEVWRLANPDVHLIVAVWPAVLFDATEPEPVKPVAVVPRPIPATRPA